MQLGLAGLLVFNAGAREIFHLLAQALADCDYLGEPGSRERALAFVNTGEASGNLPEMLLRHVTFETDAINERAQQLATWAPRVVYAMVVVWMAMGLLAPAFQKP